MGAAASLCVDALDVDDAERVARHDTALVQTEAVLALGLRLVHEALRDVVPIVDEAVGSVFYLLLLLAGERLEVSDVQMCLLLCLFGARLPNMGTKNLATGGEDDVSASMVRLQLETALGVDGAVDSLADDVGAVGDLWFHLVKHALAHFEHVGDLEDDIDAFDCHRARVVLLTAGGRVEAALVENDQVFLVLFELIGEHFDDLSLKVHRMGVVKVDAARLRQVDRAVEDLFRRLHHLLLSCRDLVVQVARGSRPRNLGDRVNWDAPGSHGQNPIVNRQLVLFLLQQLLQLNCLSLIRMQPSLILNLNHLSERLVFWELPIDTFKVSLMMLENLNKAVHSELVPPATLFQ